VTTTTNTPRVFKIGAQRIVEDNSTSTLTNEQVRDLLKASYPEVANATIRERTETTDSGLIRVVDFLQQPARKG
jgi:hypothetical protein